METLEKKPAEGVRERFSIFVEGRGGVTAIAEETGISHMTFRQVLNGRNLPSVQTLSALKDHYGAGFDVNYILSGEGGALPGSTPTGLPTGAAEPFGIKRLIDALTKEIDEYREREKFFRRMLESKSFPEGVTDGNVDKEKGGRVIVFYRPWYESEPEAA